MAQRITQRVLHVSSEQSTDQSDTVLEHVRVNGLSKAENSLTILLAWSTWMAP